MLSGATTNFIQVLLAPRRKYSYFVRIILCRIFRASALVRPAATPPAISPPAREGLGTSGRSSAASETTKTPFPWGSVIPFNFLVGTTATSSRAACTSGSPTSAPLESASSTACQGGRGSTTGTQGRWSTALHATWYFFFGEYHFGFFNCQIPLLRTTASAACALRASAVPLAATACSAAPPVRTSAGFAEGTGRDASPRKGRWRSRWVGISIRLKQNWQNCGVCMNPGALVTGRLEGFLYLLRRVRTVHPFMNTCIARRVNLHQQLHYRQGGSYLMHSQDVASANKQARIRITNHIHWLFLLVYLQRETVGFLMMQTRLFPPHFPGIVVL